MGSLTLKPLFLSSQAGRGRTGRPGPHEVVWKGRMQPLLAAESKPPARKPFQKYLSGDAVKCCCQGLSILRC